MNISIICVGKLKEKYWVDAVKEYTKRISAYSNLEIIEIKESLLKGDGAFAENAVKFEEGQEILRKIKDGSYVITLEIMGKKLSSEDFAGKIQELCIRGESNFTFIIGGSLGIDKAVSDRADYKLSFSPMTFPHQMMRVILLEQIYRAFKINRNETYHK